MSQKMKEFDFDYTRFVKSIKLGQKVAHIEDADLMKASGYSTRSTFYDNMNLNTPSMVPIDKAAMMAVATNTSLYHLMLGKGPRSFDYKNFEATFKLMELFQDNDQEHYGVLFELIMSLTSEQAHRLQQMIFFMMEKDMLK